MQSPVYSIVFRLWKLQQAYQMLRVSLLCGPKKVMTRPWVESGVPSLWSSSKESLPSYLAANKQSAGPSQPGGSSFPLKRWALHILPFPHLLNEIIFAEAMKATHQAYKHNFWWVHVTLLYQSTVEFKKTERGKREHRESESFFSWPC